MNRTSPATVPPASAETTSPFVLFGLEALLAGCLITLVFVVYFRLNGAGFVNYDDNLYVTRNLHVLEGLTPANVKWAFTTFDHSNWHPLTWLSLQFDRTFFGPEPAYFHRTNVILHALAAAILFLTLRAMTGATWSSWFVAGLFALHPLHVESVAWIAERKDVLSALFWMLTMAAYAGYVARPGKVRYAAVVVTYALGLMAKPMLISLPFVLLLLDWWPLRRWGFPKALIEKIPLLLLATVSVIITVWAQSAGGAVQTLEKFPLSSRTANAVLAVTAYMGQTFWPQNLAVFYPYEYPNWSQARVLASAAFLIVATLAIVVYRKRFPYLLTGWLWFVGALIPVLGLVQVGIQARADRYTYLPHIGLFIGLVWAGADLVQHQLFRRAVWVGGVGALVACAVLSWIQAGYWHDSVTLWQRTIDVTIHNSAARSNLGVALADEGQYVDALKQFDLGLQDEPNNPKLNFHRALALHKLKSPSAIMAFKRTVELDPDYLEAHRFLAELYGKEGNTAEATREIQEILRLAPHDLQGQYRMGLALIKEFRMAEARPYLEEARHLNPKAPEPANYLGLTYAWEGRWAEAEEQYRTAVRLNNSYAEAYCNLGIALARQGKTKDAREPLAMAVRLDGSVVGFHCHLAWAMTALGEKDSARREYEIASRMKPDWPQQAAKLAWSLATDPIDQKRNASEALMLAQEACQATAGAPQAPCLDALAAAYAESNKFTDAMITAKEAAAVAASDGKGDEAKAIQERLLLYADHKPFRSKTETPPTKAS